MANECGSRTRSHRKSSDCPCQKNYVLLIVQSTAEPGIRLGTKSILSVNVSVEISALSSTIKMISAFVSPGEKTAEIKSLRLLLIYLT